MIALTIASATLLCCNNAPAINAPLNDTTKLVNTTKPADSINTPPTDIDTSDFAIEYITIADTGLNYFKLRAVMFSLNKLLGWPIDTLGRYYDPAKNKIVLPDNADDEMYRGEYIERRYPSENMSLEYFKIYSDASTLKNITLVCGLYETQKSADSLLSILKPYAPHAFVQKAKLYMGCEH